MATLEANWDKVACLMSLMFLLGGLVSMLIFRRGTGS
jgi:hypothetical protein